MTSVELIEEVSKKLGFKKPFVALVISAFLEEMAKALDGGESVKLRTFGTLSPKTLKPATYFGGKRTVGLRKTVRFKASRRSKWRSSESSSKTNK